MSKLLDLGNPVFSSYVLWSSVLVLKMLAMSLLTAVHRFKNQVSTISTIYIMFYYWICSSNKVSRWRWCHFYCTIWAVTLLSRSCNSTVQWWEIVVVSVLEWIPSMFLANKLISMIRQFWLARPVSEKISLRNYEMDFIAQNTHTHR